MQATQIAKDEGLLDKQRDKKANRFKSKEEIKVSLFVVFRELELMIYCCKIQPCRIKIENSMSSNTF